MKYGSSPEAVSDLPQEDSPTTQYAQIVVENARKWFGDQRLGAFHVALDGAGAGMAFPGQQLNVECAPGTHTVRIRQWWYRSRPVTVDLSPGERCHLVADAPRGGGLLRRMATLMVRPSRSLSLNKGQGSASKQ